MSNPSDFKGDLFSAIFEHLKVIFKPALLIGLVAYAISTLTTYGLLSKIGINLNELQNMSRSGGSDPEAMLDYFEGLQDTLLNGLQQYWPLLVVGYLFIFLFQIYVNVLMLKTSDDIALGGDGHLPNMFSKVSIGMLFKVLLSYFVFLFIVLAIIGIAILPIAIHRMMGLLLILTIPFAGVLLTRLAFYFPALVIGDMGIMESIKWSFKHITWIRALKIIGIGLVVVIVLAMIGGIAGAIASAMGTIGTGLSQVINAVSSVISLAGGAALYTGLWYKFTHTEMEQDSELEAIGTE